MKIRLEPKDGFDHEDVNYLSVHNDKGQELFTVYVDGEGDVVIQPHFDFPLSMDHDTESAVGYVLSSGPNSGT